MINLIIKNKLLFIGFTVGALGGYLYYYFVGCVSGTCPITSKPLNSTLYGAVMGGLLFSIFKKEKNIHKKIKNQMMNSLKTILDVRTEEEFAGGHIAGSINIPLHEIPGHLSEIKNMNQPVILCCASGNRSSQAAAYLKNLGIECKNGGSWLDLKFN